MADTKITKLRNLMTPVVNYFTIQSKLETGEYPEDKYEELSEQLYLENVQARKNLKEIRDIIKEIPNNSIADSVKLTGDILLKIGFKKINHIHGYSFYSLSKSKKNKCHIDIYENKTQYMGYSVKHCEYLHELQNLFFTINGKELSIEDVK